MEDNKNKSLVEKINENIEKFDILETFTSINRNEIFTPRRTCDFLLDSLPEEVWSNPNYRWLIPATKNGIFEREIAIRLNEGLENIIKDEEKRKKHILQKMIFSLGQTKASAHMARRTLYYCSQANRSFDGERDECGKIKNRFAIGNGTWFLDEEGNVKSPITEHEYDKNNRCKFCGIPFDLNNKQNAYEFIHVEPDKLNEHLSERFFGNNKEMKFDIVIGNPPYQLGTRDDDSASAKPIYHLFVKNAIEGLRPKYVCMIIPARWLTGCSSGLDEFRKNMLEDRHIRNLTDYVDSKKCFSTVDVKGGICHFLWDKDYNGKCHTKFFDFYDENDKPIESNRYLKDKDLDLDIYIRNPMLLSILKKVKLKEKELKITKHFNEIVSELKPYGLRSDFFKDPKKYGLPEIYETPDKVEGNSYLTIYGLSELKRTKRYIPLDYPLPKKKGLNQYKIFIPQAYGEGVFGELPSQLIFSKPKELCTETFLQIGPFDSFKERDNCFSYIKTKFFRSLVSILKSTQSCTQKCYTLVPLLNFDKPWSDQELCKMFNLNYDEKNFIEEKVKSWNGPELENNE